MQYWKTHQKDLILFYLNLANDQKSQLTLWQNRGSTRITFDAQFIEVSKKNCRLKLSENPHHSFDNSEPFFIHIKSLDIIFKKENYNMIAEYIDFYMPSDVQIYEKRKTKRFYYKYQDHKNITFHSESNNHDEKPEFIISSVIVDISTSGVGLVLAKDQTQKVKVGDNVYLMDITDQKLPEPFKVKVVYMQQYQSKEQGLYKLGILFDDQLDSISYKSITSLVEIKQMKAQGLSPDQYCGLDHEEQIKTLNVVEMKNQVLAANIKDNIDYLDRLRYMTIQMKVDFLKSINHDLLAVALRLSSKELIYDLFNELTKTMQEEFLDKLKYEKPASAVCKAQDEIIKIIRQKEASGEILLDPTAFTTYV